MNDIRPMYIQVRCDEWERMKNELQELRGDKAHLEMVLNRDFKPIYLNVDPTAPVHKVKIDTEVKL